MKTRLECQHCGEPLGQVMASAYCPEHPENQKSDFPELVNGIMNR